MEFICTRGKSGHAWEVMKCLLALLLTMLLAPLASAEVRAWKTADGSRTLLAEYVSSRDGKVTIRRKRDRRIFTISLSTLSEADQDYVKEREEAGPSNEKGGSRGCRQGVCQAAHRGMGTHGGTWAQASDLWSTKAVAGEGRRVSPCCLPAWQGG